jgi:hypothetical protein
MQAKTKMPGIMALLVIGTLVITVPMFTQDKQADNMQVVREKIRADKKLFVAEAMELKESESKGFWSVYESYQKDLSKTNDRLLKLIQDYASHYPNMTNEAAKKLVDDYLSVEGERLKIRQSYLPRFRQVLPETKVARFYQLENKIQAAVNYDLAAGIPLVE